MSSSLPIQSPTARLSPRESANFIVSAIAKDSKPLITINNEGVRRVAEMVLNEISTTSAMDGEGKDAGPKPWEFAAQEVLPTFYPYPKSVEELLKPCYKRDVLNWIFFIDTINFSFWTDEARGEEPFEVDWSGKTYTGYYAACAWLNSMVISGWPITEAYNMESLSVEKSLDFEQQYGKDNSIVKKIPMLEERLKVLNEAGKVLMEKFSKPPSTTDFGSGGSGNMLEDIHHLQDLGVSVGSFANCVAQCGRSAQKLVELVVEHFPSYRDYAQFRNRPVSFLKRAQILAADVNSYLRAAGDPNAFTDMETLTMFPDYRVPQILAHLGVLNYSDDLMGKFATNELWECGCEEEVVLRAFSIKACDLITAEVDRLLEAKRVGTGEKSCDATPKLTAVDVDMYLWVLRRKLAKEIEEAEVPFHRIRCIYY